MPSSPEDRLYPVRPILAVSAAVFRGGRVLLTRRACEPMKGRYSLPGGVVEVGETLAQAIAREIDEEIGIEVDLLAFNRHVEPIIEEAGRIKAHFVIASFVARWRRLEPRLSDEVDAFDWLEPEDCTSLLTTPELPEVVLAAARIERSLS